jgi:hypothetical protein
MTKRTRFFLGHLTASIFIGLILITLVFGFWYPTPFAAAEGVTNIFMMLLAIDVIVGPILGYLVYKEGKKTLKMDLAVIIVIQLAAMLYGVYSITQSRPAWIVQNGSIFQLVRANAILPEDQKDAASEYQTNSWSGPKWVAVDAQHAQYERAAEPTLVPNVYTRLDVAVDRIRQNAKSLDLLENYNDQNRIKAVLNKYPEANAWMPLRTTGDGLVVLLQQQDAKVIAVVDLRPWQ